MIKVKQSRLVVLCFNPAKLESDPKTGIRNNYDISIITASVFSMMVLFA